jgi:hypothetical protein
MYYHKEGKIKFYKEELERSEEKLESALDKLENVSLELEELQNRYKAHNVYDEMKIEAFWRNLGKYSLDYLENPEVTDNKGHHE